MRAQDFMSKAVQTVPPTMAAEDAWQLMRLKAIHHLVVNEGARLVGLLSDRDVGGRQGASVRKGRTVADLMSSRVVTAPPTISVREAANLMRGHSIGASSSRSAVARSVSLPWPTCWSSSAAGSTGRWRRRRGGH
jgi:CBS domain-containing protein